MHVDENSARQLSWRTSSFCSTGACVEVAFADGTVVVRDSNNPSRQSLVYTTDEWRDFVAGVKVGEFDV